MRLTRQNIEEALALPLSGTGSIFASVSTDTRTLQPGGLFVALANPKADGHQFVPQALAAGATGLVVSQPIDAPPDVAVFQVPDTQAAYGQLARWWRDRFDIPIIAVTGSVGKTTTKEMLVAALAPLGLVLKTAASQNNETGVPKALLQLNTQHKAAVIEMGMRGAGQIAYLCGIARPTLGVVTLIGENHIELLGSREAIADAKGELLDALPTDGLAVLNADDPYLGRLRGKVKGQTCTFGLTPEADYYAADVTRTENGWRFTVRETPVEVASPSRHDVVNALAALAVADMLSVPLTEAARSLQTYAPPPMRMQVIPTLWGGTVLNDAYNAAPASVRSALETLAGRAAGRKIAFLGDMKELGDLGEAAHRELGGTITTLGGLDALYTVGSLAAQIPSATDGFPNSDTAARFARESLRLQKGDTILVKGSRAMAMERIVNALQERGPDDH